jgi:hypothetical protein
MTHIYALIYYYIGAESNKTQPVGWVGSDLKKKKKTGKLIFSENHFGKA